MNARTKELSVVHSCCRLPNRLQKRSCDLEREIQSPPNTLIHKAGNNGTFKTKFWTKKSINAQISMMNSPRPAIISCLSTSHPRQLSTPQKETRNDRIAIKQRNENRQTAKHFPNVLG